MKFSLNWLKKHIELTSSVEEVLTRINEIGLEVESVDHQRIKYNKFIVAEILETTPHPNADSLRVCKVNTGNEVLNVVCGAPNARAGIKVVLAMVGAIVPNGSFQIKQSKIRGVGSEGMLCSADELALGAESDGIIELDSSAIVGQAFAEHRGLDDVIIAVALTPNKRRDCGSVYGIARDLAAAGCGALKNTAITINQGEEPTISLEIAADDQCHQFNFFTCIGITQKSLHLKDFKLMAQVKNLHDNPLVNLSNFTMMNLGNPNHIYDLQKIKGNKISVRLSQNNEKFIALGGKEYALPGGLLVICDAEKVLSVAGVMGGELSKVDENTKDILVEVANFQPNAVALAAQALGLISDSKYRFEGGIDIASVDRASDWIRQFFSGASGVKKVYGQPYNYLTEVEICLNRVESYLGIDIDDGEVQEILEKLSFEPQSIGNRKFQLQIPSWKQGNIHSYYEVIEDLLRMGLINKINSIESSKRFISGRQVTNNMMRVINNNSHENIFNPRLIEHSTGSQLRNTLIGRGMHEVLTWSFYSQEEHFSIESNHISKFCLNKSSDAQELISIKNPINHKFQLMRRSLVPNLVNTIATYPNNQERSLSIFEIGNVYSAGLPGFQSMALCGLRTGVITQKQKFSFYDAREDLLSLFKTLGMSDKLINYSYDSEVPQYYHPRKAIRIKLGQNVVGIVGELHPEIVEKFDLTNKIVAVFELFTNNIPAKLYKIQPKKELALPTQQRLYRDLAFIIDNNVMVGEITKAINSIKEKLIDDTEVYDVYGLEDGKKSVAIKIWIQPQDHITDEVINAIIDRVIKTVNDKVGGKLRDK
jgi:phenylalanyl-tRNA synthetase beta chain